MDGYVETQIYGKLIAGEREYWIANPYPVFIDTPWGSKVRGFWGVSVSDSEFGPNGSNEFVYPTLCPIIVSGTWHVVLEPPVKGWIWCKAAELVAQDFFNAEVTDPEEPPSLIGIEWLGQLSFEKATEQETLVEEW